MIIDLADIKIKASVADPEFDKGYGSDIYLQQEWDVDKLIELGLYWEIAKKLRKLAEKLEYGLILYGSGREEKVCPKYKKLCSE